MQTTNPTLPFEEIEIGGTTYKMCFDYDSLANAEAIFLRAGVDVNLNFCLPSLSFSSVRTLFACSLLTYQPGMKYADAVALVTRDNNISILQAIIRAWNLSVPDAEETAGAEVQPDPPQPEPQPGA
jgi:hypothetical protein